MTAAVWSKHDWDGRLTAGNPTPPTIRLDRKSGFRVAPKSCASSTLAFAIAANWPGSGTTATVDTLVRMRWPAAVLPWKRCVNTCACVWGRREGALVSGQN